MLATCGLPLMCSEARLRGGLLSGRAPARARIRPGRGEGGQEPIRVAVQPAQAGVRRAGDPMRDRVYRRDLQVLGLGAERDPGVPERAFVPPGERRVYHPENGGAPIGCPLIAAITASNELPPGEELGAVYDRLLVRLETGYLQDPSAFAALIKSAVTSTSGLLAGVWWRGGQREPPF
jgi:hypothetical protein